MFLLIKTSKKPPHNGLTKSENTDDVHRDKNDGFSKDLKSGDDEESNPDSTISHSETFELNTSSDWMFAVFQWEGSSVFCSMLQ